MAPSVRGLTRSLRFRLGVFFLLASIPLSALLVFQNWYAVQVVHAQAADDAEGLLDVYLTRLDSDLDHISQYLKVAVVTDPSVPTLDAGPLDPTYAFEKLQLATRLTSALTLYPLVRGFFAYSARTDDFLAQTMPVPEGRGVLEREAFHAFLRSFTPPLDQRWVPARVGDRSVLFRAVRSDPTLLGAWVDVGSALEPMKLSDSDGRGKAFLVASDNQTYPDTPEVAAQGISLAGLSKGYRLSGSPQPYLVTTVTSTAGAFQLVSIRNDAHILQQLPVLRTLNALVAGFVLVLILGFFLFLRWTVLAPLSHLMDAMARLQAGDWETRLSDPRASREFEVVNLTFNDMASQIRGLRIAVYEEQLHAQKSELLSLRLQINPHFFLNSLNILYQLAQVKNYDLIQELSMALSKYFQFMFRSNSDFVLLREEWEHVKTYLRIQELRYPNSLVCQLVAPDPLPEVPAPPLMIQTFVENAIQHATRQQTGLTLRLSVQESGDQVVIRVEDSGPGFAPEVLERLAGTQEELAAADHLGIANVRRRLQLLYGDRARVSFSNFPSPEHGAVVEIGLPSGAHHG